MHAYRQFIEAEMKRRSWTAADLMRASKMSKQALSKVLNDTRDGLNRLPEDATIDGLATAFSVDRKVVLRSIALAMGLPVDDVIVVNNVDRATNEDLLRVLSERLLTREAGEEHADGSPSNTDAPGTGANAVLVGLAADAITAPDGLTEKQRILRDLDRLAETPPPPPQDDDGA